MSVLILLSIIFVIAAFFTRCYIRFAHSINLLDIPNQRSSHTTIVPRGGGIVFMVIWLLSIVFAFVLRVISVEQLLILLPGSLLVALTGFLDDRFTLSVKIRALIYFIAATFTLIIMHGFPQLILTEHLVLPLSWLGWIVAIFAIVWSINLFNFMDGTDGIAGIEALFTLGVGGYFLWLAGGQGMAILAWLLAVSVLGFLVWNKPPAKLFMGDVGSAGLGFCIMVFALVGERFYQVPALLWFMLYGVFLFDATITLLRRMKAGEAWHKPHRLHAYQRLHQYGWSHSRLLLKVVLVNCILALFSILGFYYRNIIPILLIASILILIFLYFQVEQRKPMFPKNN